MVQLGRIFICYRRDDSGDVTDRIWERLSRAFGRQNLFRDIDSIAPGRDFRKEILQTLESCRAVLVVIGREWIRDIEGRRRLDSAEDHVRIEIETALAREGLPIIPVFVRNVQMPAREELPDSLRDLVFRNAARVRPAEDFDADIKRLIRKLKPVLRVSEAEPGEAPGEIRASVSGVTASPGAPANVSAVKEHQTQEERSAPLPQTESPAATAAAGIESPATRSSSGESIRDAQSRLDPLSAPVTFEAEPLQKAEPTVSGQGAATTSATAPVSLERISKEDIHETQGKRNASPSGATMERPFENSLGMRFVSVPGTDVLFSVWETRVKDYRAFREATKKTRGFLRSLFAKLTEPSFSQTGDHPAVNVSWEDATAFCEWLSRKEGRKYRLPTDHEWSCAVGIGDREDAKATPKSKNWETDNVFPWGEKWPPPNDAGNYFGDECGTSAGLTALKAAGYDTPEWGVIEGFNDGNVFTAPVGSFRSNGLGIYDLGGNVWEWCQDEYEPGSDLRFLRVLRGGSWHEGNRHDLLSSGRSFGYTDTRRGDMGFRVVVEAVSGR